MIANVMVKLVVVAVHICAYLQSNFLIPISNFAYLISLSNAESSINAISNILYFIILYYYYFHILAFPPLFYLAQNIIFHFSHFQSVIVD